MNWATLVGAGTASTGKGREGRSGGVRTVMSGRNVGRPSMAMEAHLAMGAARAHHEDGLCTGTALDVVAVNGKSRTDPRRIHSRKLLGCSSGAGRKGTDRRLEGSMAAMMQTDGRLG